METPLVGTETLSRLAKIRCAKRLYYRTKFDSFKNDTRSTWKCINNLIGKGTKVNRVIEKLNVNGVIVEDAVKIADAFNQYFSSIGVNIANSIQNSNNHPMDYMSGTFLNSFVFFPVTSRDVENVIKSLKNKSCNVDALPVTILKIISYVISPVLSSIINCSLSTGSFPRSLKTARVVPIHKKGDLAEIGNYRPVSILPVYSKIFEKVVYRQVYKYLEKYSVLAKTQYGFRSGRSTIQAILKFMNYVYSILDNNDNVLSIFLDFSKAFDCVDHSILLSKLYFYGFRGVCHEWFNSYLSNRYQYVSLSGVSSDKAKMSHGVPQGSVLGPLLFLIFINDFERMSEKFMFTLFADDSTLSYRFHVNSASTVSVLQINDELVKVSEWLIANKVLVNIDKTKYMIFSYGRKIVIDPLIIGGGVIEKASSLKFLGICINDNLNFDSHITYLLSKVSRSVGILNRLKTALPADVLCSLYQTLIRPYFMYGIEVWGCAPDTSIERLFIAQKSAVRVVCNMSYYAHTSEKFKSLNILKIRDEYVYSIGVRMFKAVNLGVDIDLFNGLQSHQLVHNYTTRNNSNYITAQFHKAKSQNSWKIWNSLLNEVRHCLTLLEFKKKLKTHMISEY